MNAANICPVCGKPYKRQRMISARNIEMPRGTEYIHVEDVTTSGMFAFVNVIKSCTAPKEGKA